MPNSMRPARRPARKRRHLPHLQKLQELRGHATLQRLRRGLVRPRSAASAGQPPSRSSRLRRLAIPATTLVMLALVILIGRRFAIQQLDIENNIRNQLIPRLEKQLGQRIEVGAIESDWLSRVILNDVVIGRDPKLPTGALLQAKRIIVNVDIISLALRRVDPLLALRSATIESPQIFLRRTANGRLNVQELFGPAGAPTAGVTWTGVLQVRNGRVWYEDVTVRSASGRMLQVDARSVESTVRFNGEQDIDFALDIDRVSVISPATVVRTISLSGTAAPNGKWLVLNAKWPSAPAPLLTAYGFKGDVVAQSGTVGGDVHFAWEAAPAVATTSTKTNAGVTTSTTTTRTRSTPTAQWMVSGNVQVRGVTGYAQAVKHPLTNRPILVQNVTGLMSFRDQSFSTTGLTLTALNTPLRTVGKVVLLPNPVFDLRIASDAADTMQLIQLWRQPAGDRFFLSGGRARAEAHLTGEPQAMRINGSVTVPEVAVRQAQAGSWRGGALRATFNGEGTPSGVTLKSNISVPGFSGTHPQHGQWRASELQGDVQLAAQGRTIRLEASVGSPVFSGRHPQWGAAKATALRSNIRWAGTDSKGLLNTQFNAASASASSQALGNWNAGGMRGVLRWDGRAPGNRIRAQINTNTLSGGRSGQGNLRTGVLRATVDTVGTGANLRLATTFDARSATATINANSELRGSRAQAGVLRGRMNWNSAQRTPRLTALLNTSDAVVTSPRYGRFEAGVLRSDVQWNAGTSSSTALTGRINARFAATQTGAATPQGRWSSASLGGLVQWNSRARTLGSITTDLRATGFGLRSPRYGRVLGQAVRVIAAAPNLSNPRLRGTASFSNINSSEVNTAALSPALGRQVRDVGLLSGRVQFANLSPDITTTRDEAVARGSIRLTGATVVTNTTTGERTRLRNITAQVGLADGQLQVWEARAASEFGPLLANLRADIRTGAVNVQLTGAQVTLDARRLNPYLTAQGIALEGTATGRLNVTTTNASPLILNARFDLVLPTAIVRTLDTRGRSQQLLRSSVTRVRGRGVISFASSNNWRFVGESTLAAAEATILRAGPTAGGAAVLLPAWLAGSNLDQMRIETRGSLTRTANGIEPRLAGTASFVQISLPSPAASGATVQMAAARSTPERTWLQLADTNLEYVIRPGELQVSSFSTRSGGGQWDGHARLRGGVIAAQVLGRNLNAARVESLARTAMQQPGEPIARPTVRGTAFVRADITGTLGNLQADVQTRLYNGDVRLPGAVLPVDAARADLSLQLPFTGKVPLQDLVVWHAGGRVQARGTVEQAPDGVLRFDLNTTINNVRVQEITRIPALLPALRSIQDAGELDGLLSGEFRITGNAEQPQARGRVALRLAQVFGLNVETTTAQLNYETTTDGPRLRVTELAGRTEDTPFSGAFTADFADNKWSANLSTQGVAAGRILRAVGRSEEQRNTLRDLPLRADIRADVQLTGTLRTPTGEAGFMPQDGTIMVQAPDLRWRGQNLGDLTADLVMRNGVLLANAIQLRRDQQARIAEGTNEPPGADDAASVVRLTGTLPVSLDAPDLDASITLSNERLSFVIESLEEVQRTLTERGESVVPLDRLIKLVRSLPPDLEGDIGLQADLSGRWRAPVVAVNRLTVRNARADAERRLPDLTAAFTYDDGSISVQQGEVRLASTNPDEEDTVLRIQEGGRIVPDGEVSIVADVLNANLMQLATWIPALRDVNGNPLLRGDLSQFTFQIAGTTFEPVVTGSILAENLTLRTYTLDRLRIARFDIGNGALRIAPGNLTIVKGSFQSAVAWGEIPWDWALPGPDIDGPMEIHLPLQRGDFGALAGVFLPAVTNVDAEDFSGSVDIVGSLEQPQISGVVAIKDGRFRLDPVASPVEVGVTGFSGTVRFINGNQLLIEPADALRGKIVHGDQVQAPTTGNAPAEARNPLQARPRAVDTTDTPTIGGNFALSGGVRLSLNPENLADLRGALSRHRYDLQFSVANVEYSGGGISGIKNGALGLIWRTGPGAPAQSQNVRWMLSAASGAGGRGRRTGKATGTLTSLASLRLHPDFAAVPEAFLHSQVQTFQNAEDFREMDVYRQLSAAGRTTLQDSRSRISLHDFGFSVRDLGMGMINGTVLLDNQPAPAPLAPGAAPAPRLATLDRPRRRLVDFSTAINGNATATSAGRLAQESLPGNSRAIQPRLRPAQTGDVVIEGDPIALRGTLTVSNTELYGVPAGGTGRPVNLPAAPVLDLRLELGRDTKFISSNLRADLTGAVDINGTPREPQVLGTFSARGGQIRFPNANARLTEGEITISARRDPLRNEIRARVDIDATAVGRVGRYEITLRMRGPLDTGEASTQNLAIDLTSNPPLSRDEAFAQLLGTSALNARLGEGGLANSGDVDRAYQNTLVGLLSGSLFTGIERSIERTLGLSSVTFEYRYNEPIGVQIGKAIGDRVYITYQRTIGSTPGRPTPYTLRIEYRIKGDIQLGVQTDEQERRQITIQKTWRF